MKASARFAISSGGTSSTCGDSFDLLFHAIRNYYGCTLFNEATCSSFAYSRTAAGDDGNFS
jgi:hypothetical protein